MRTRVESSRTPTNIIGAGLSGLVAAICLAREGREVHLFDREERIGGHPHWHPSIHATVLQVEKTCHYLDLDLTECFRPLEQITFYRYGRRDVFLPRNMVICERGPRPSSLDVRLFGAAVELGVSFHPVQRLDETLLDPSRDAIIATGLDEQAYGLLDLASIPVYGYRAAMNREGEGFLLSYMLECTNFDFAYVCGMNGVLFALLFSRQKLTAEHLRDFKRVLKTTEGLEFAEWAPSRGAVPQDARLFHQGKILAGTLSGMIDPFLLHGVSGALLSGKIAARAVTDTAGAQEEFAYFTRNFAWKRRLKSVSTWLPLKSQTVPACMWLDSLLRGVGCVA
jgi:NAD(P)-binding Rossmann-like domain